MIETHPFGNFIPENPRYLILGSFTSRQYYGGGDAATYDWFYGTKQNQFWPILEEVYGKPLRDKTSKQALLTQLRTAIADIIYQCERKSNTSLDTDLVNIIYNENGIVQILDENRIEKIFFTSCYTEKRFKTVFKELILRHPACELVTLPSPSPRYARMTREQKTIRYKEMLPKV